MCRPRSGRGVPRPRDNERATKALHKKIEQARPTQLHGHVLSVFDALNKIYGKSIGQQLLDAITNAAVGADAANAFKVEIMRPATQ